MINESDNKKEATLLFESFDGGGPSYNVKIDDESVVCFNLTKQYHRPEHNEMTGAGFTVKVTFFGLKAGRTAATITCRSPIADNYDAVYDIEVDEALNITVTEKEITEVTN